MKTQDTGYDFPTIGCYVDESCGSADDCNSRTIEFAECYGFKGELPEAPEDDVDGEYSQLLSDTADSAVDYLNELETRSFMYWTHEDNSLLLMANVDGAREDVGFVSGGEDSDPEDDDYPASDYRGEWLHVNDHGNATLYVREDLQNPVTGPNYTDREIWSVC